MEREKDELKLINLRAVNGTSMEYHLYTTCSTMQKLKLMSSHEYFQNLHYPEAVKSNEGSGVSWQLSKMTDSSVL